MIIKWFKKIFILDTSAVFEFKTALFIYSCLHLAHLLVKPTILDKSPEITSYSIIIYDDINAFSVFFSKPTTKSLKKQQLKVK